MRGKTRKTAPRVQFRCLPARRGQRVNPYKTSKRCARHNNSSIHARPSLSLSLLPLFQARGGACISRTKVYRYRRGGRPSPREIPLKLISDFGKRVRGTKDTSISSAFIWPRSLFPFSSAALGVFFSGAGGLSLLRGRTLFDKELGDIGL